MEMWSIRKILAIEKKDQTELDCQEKRIDNDADTTSETAINCSRKNLGN